VAEENYLQLSMSIKSLQEKAKACVVTADGPAGGPSGVGVRYIQLDQL